MNRPPPPGWRVGRRTSFARRDSNLAILGALFAGVTLALALLLLLIQRVNPEQGGRLRGAMVDGLSPILSVVRAPVDAVRAVGANIGSQWQAARRARALEAELVRVRARAARADLLALEVARMDRLIGLRRPERRLVASGIASASSATGASRTAIVSVGLVHGVRPRMPAIAADGLAGRVTDVGARASRILLLTDANSRVPVKVLRTGWTGLAVGSGGARLDFLFDPQSGSDRIRVGDRLVTSGDGGLYPPGVPVAVVTDAQAAPPRARPLANPTGLGAVMIEAPWLPPPAFVPAPPAPAEADRPAPPQVERTPPALPSAPPAA